MPPVHSPALASSTLVVFGKTPQMGDFVRVGAPGRGGEALEQWVQQGLIRAESRLGESWASAYARGAAHAFVFRGPRGADETLVGVVVPSSDAVGRRFPLLVYAPLPIARGEFPWPHVLPMALGEFFDMAAGTLLEAPEFAGSAELVEAVRPLMPPQLDRAELHARDYDAWTSGALLTQAWSVVFGEASASLAPKAIHVVADALAPFRGEAAPATTLGLRLPLGAGGAGAAVFWLDLIRRLAGSPHGVRTCFWSFDGADGSVIVQIGDTPASTLAELWAPGTDSETLCDLTEEPNVDVTRLLSELSPALLDALRSPETLVLDFLDRIPR